MPKDEGWEVEAGGSWMHIQEQRADGGTQQQPWFAVSSGLPVAPRGEASPSG